MAKYLLDTTAPIDHLRGRREVVELITTLAREGHLLGLCSISGAELHSGLNQEKSAKADRLIDGVDFYEVTRQVAKQSWCYLYDFARQGTAHPTADTLMAATAISEGDTLVTANIRDLPMEEIELIEHP